MADKDPGISGKEKEERPGITYRGTKDPDAAKGTSLDGDGQDRTLHTNLEDSWGQGSGEDGGDTQR